MLSGVEAIAVRPFPSRGAGTWSCTRCGLGARVDRSWTVDVRAVNGRRFSIVVCPDCVEDVAAPRERSVSAA